MTVEHRDLSAILCRMNEFPLPAAFFGQGRHVLIKRPRKPSLEKGSGVLAEDFRLCPAIQFFRPGIPEDNPAFQVADEDGVVGKLKQVGLPPQVLRPLSNLLFQLAPGLLKGLLGHLPFVSLVELSFDLLAFPLYPLTVGDVGQDGVHRSLSVDAYGDALQLGIERVYPSFLFSTSWQVCFGCCLQYPPFVKIEEILGLGMDEEGKRFLDEAALFNAEKAARGEVRPG